MAQDGWNQAKSQAECKIGRHCEPPGQRDTHRISHSALIAGVVIESQQILRNKAGIQLGAMAFQRNVRQCRFGTPGACRDPISPKEEVREGCSQDFT